ILELVRAEIEKSGYENAIGRRVVLTGGSAQLSGMRQLAEMVLDKTVRIAKPYGVEGLTSLSGVPQFATATGLISYGAQRQLQHGFVPGRAARSSAKGENWFAGLQRWMKESFQAS